MSARYVVTIIADTPEKFEEAVESARTPADDAGIRQRDASADRERTQAMSNRQKPTGITTPTTQGGGPATYWNGLPTIARRGTAIVADAPEFPKYWAKTEGLIGQRIAVVEVVLDGVNYGGGIDYLDDRKGQGWRKVTVGHGGPSHGHANVGIEPGSFIPTIEVDGR